MAGFSRVTAATNVSTTGQGIKGAMHKSVEATVLDISADKRYNMVRNISTGDRGREEFSAKSPIKSSSSGPKTAVTGRVSTSKPAGVQAIEKGHQHKPFHFSSDFPYQWKDLAKNDKRDNKVKETKATSDDGHWKTTSSMKSPVKNVAIDKKDTTKTKSNNSCVKVNNTFRVLSNENQQSFQDQDRVLIEECEEDNQDFYDVDSDKNNKKNEKERSRLKWNGEIPNENLGKGQRSAIRKQK